MSYRSVFAPGLFADQTIVVTGGGSGIGRCTAHELAYLGAHVVLIGRKQAKLDEVAQEIHQDGGSCSTHALDIRDEDALRAAVTDIVTRQGRINGLVNNAGGQYKAPGAVLRIDGGARNARRLWNLNGHDNTPTFNGFHRSQTSESSKHHSKNRDNQSGPVTGLS